MVEGGDGEETAGVGKLGGLPWIMQEVRNGRGIGGRV